MRISVIPITVMIDPVTTAGKKRSSRLINGATTMPKTPATMTEPKIAGSPSAGLPAMASMGEREAKVTPIITGRRMPNGPTPQAWIRVAIPQANRSALIKMAIWSRGNFSAAPRMSGTATAPAYITSTCCNASSTRRTGGGVAAVVPDNARDMDQSMHVPCRKRSDRAKRQRSIGARPTVPSSSRVCIQVSKALSRP